MTRRGLTALQRWEMKVQRAATCWLWTAALTQGGYGQCGDAIGRSTQAHRFSYEAFVGPIPGGMDIDHLCNVRRCVNPAHLEPVTRRENLRRARQRRLEQRDAA